MKASAIVLILGLLSVEGAKIFHVTDSLTAKRTESNVAILSSSHGSSERKRDCSFHLEDWGIRLQHWEYQQSTDAAICACVAGSSSQPNFFSCSVKLVQQLWRDGILSKEETQAIRTSVAQSNLWNDREKTTSVNFDSVDSETVSHVPGKATRTKKILPSIFLQKESGKLLSTGAAAAFDACTKDVEHRASFNSCAKQVVTRLRKMSEIDKFEAKALRSAIDAFHEEIVLASWSGTDDLEQPVREETTRTSVVTPPSGKSSEDITNSKLSKKAWRGLKGRINRIKTVYNDAAVESQDKLILPNQRRGRMFLRVSKR